ncbi:MAG: hypothetical protein DRP11_00420 [Candidatus Aenigmatarchaeota archaeon]|nr:MAG: hypothetical protein DRP11_00420 [Candidatus Aenigmarchaeota archaeon]
MKIWERILDELAVGFIAGAYALAITHPVHRYGFWVWLPVYISVGLLLGWLFKRAFKHIEGGG